MQRRSPGCSALLASLSLVVAQAAYAQSTTSIGFTERPVLKVTTRDFSDREISKLLATLDALLAEEKDPARWGQNARGPLWHFARQLQAGHLTPAQEQLVTRHLDAISQARPEHAEVVAASRRIITSLTPGKAAPEIVGKDLDGVEFRLSDYRGKVVVLLFSAEWCGICRTLNPYERFLTELYENWPFAILSVETGSSPEAIRKLKSQEGLTYRSWWDARPGGGLGPIASAWNVAGYPSIYVIDPRGVIRFVDLRYEDLLKGVRQLLMEDTTTLVKNEP